MTFNRLRTTGTGDSVRQIIAYRNVVILKSDLQGIADSLAYSTEDSTFRLFDKPVLWTDNYQFYADTIWLSTERNKPKQILLRSNAFVGNRLQDGVFNQIKGRNITGDFADNRIQSVLARGNAESIYFVQDETDAYTGVNRAAAGTITMQFSEQKPSRVTFGVQPTATFFPIQKIKVKDFVLKGFVWQEGGGRGCRCNVRIKALSFG